MSQKYQWLLILFSLLVLALLVSCSGASSTDGTSDSENPVNTVDDSISLSPEEAVNLEYREKTVSSQDGVVIPSASLISGTLLHIDEVHPYRYDLPSLQLSETALKKAHELLTLFGNKSSNYGLVNAGLMMKKDAFDQWEVLMAAFVGDTGKKTVQVVSTHVRDGENSLYSSFVTGYSVAINLYEDGVTYSLASKEKPVTVNGKTMTCLEWFQDNCAKYGFIYTGLDGSANRTLATFRYVGTPHALIMQKHDIIDMQVYSSFIKDNSTYRIEDTARAVTWSVRFVPADREKGTTLIELPVGAVYTVSGNNLDGFIVAYYLPEKT